MAIIKLHRKSAYNNTMRDYKILIIGQQVGRIANGETKNFITTNGPHTVTAKIDWCSSPDVTTHTSENEINNLKVGGFKDGNWLMPMCAGVIAIHFFLKIAFNINYTIVLIIPVFILLVYYLIFARNKYLTLTEIQVKG